LGKLLSERVVELTRAGQGGSKCWPAVLLSISAKRSRRPDAPLYVLLDLIVQILDPRRAVPEKRRVEVVRFCWNVVEQAKSLGMGRWHLLARTVRPFLEAALVALGEDRPTGHLSPTIGRRLTVQQLIARLDSHQSFEIQAMAVKVLPDVVYRELHNAPRAVQDRQKNLQLLHRAVGLVATTKYYESLAPKMRETCETRMSDLKHRIERAGGASG